MADRSSAPRRAPSSASGTPEPAAVDDCSPPGWPGRRVLPRPVRVGRRPNAGRQPRQDHRSVRPSVRPLARHVPAEPARIRRLAVSDDRRWLLFPDVTGSRPPRVRGAPHPRRTNRTPHPLGHHDRHRPNARRGRVRGRCPRVLAGRQAGRLVRRAAHPRVGHGHRPEAREVPDYNAEECRFTPDGRYLIAVPGRGTARVARLGRGDRQAGGRAHAADRRLRLDIRRLAGRDQAPHPHRYRLRRLGPEGRGGRAPLAGGYESGRGAFAPDGRSVVTHDTILRRGPGHRQEPLRRRFRPWACGPRPPSLLHPRRPAGRVGRRRPHRPRLGRGDHEAGPDHPD